MNLEKRIKRLENETKPRKISSWVDFVIFATQGKEDERIEISEGLQKMLEQMALEFEKKDKANN